MNACIALVRMNIKDRWEERIKMNRNHSKEVYNNNQRKWKDLVVSCDLILLDCLGVWPSFHVGFQHHGRSLPTVRLNERRALDVNANDRSHEPVVQYFADANDLMKQ